MFSSNTFASFCYPKSCYAQNVYNYRIPFQHVFSFMASCICLSSLFYSLTHSLCLLPFISHSLIVCSFYGNINKIFHSWFLNFYYFNVQKLYYKSISLSKLESFIHSIFSSYFKITKTILHNIKIIQIKQKNKIEAINHSFEIWNSLRSWEKLISNKKNASQTRWRHFHTSFCLVLFHLQS